MYLNKGACYLIIKYFRYQMHPYGSQLWLLNRHLPLEKEPSHSIKITLVLIVFPITQIHTKKRGGYFASFVSMLYSLHSVTKMKNSFSAMIPFATENVGKKHDKAKVCGFVQAKGKCSNRHLALSVKRPGT